MFVYEAEHTRDAAATNEEHDVSAQTSPVPAASSWSEAPAGRCPRRGGGRHKSLWLHCICRKGRVVQVQVVGRLCGVREGGVS